jgi:hypothetical protein
VAISLGEQAVIKLTTQDLDTPMNAQTTNDADTAEDVQIVNVSRKADGCAGCQWRTDIRDEWCEMFRDEPEDLPCAQHDQFAPIREAMVKTGMAKLVIAAVVGSTNVKD